MIGKSTIRFMTMLVAAVAIAHGSWAAGVIVRNGAPQATIVVAKDAVGAEPEIKAENVWNEQPAANKIAAAARDLQTYIEKMSGAKLPIVADDANPTGTLILVGRSSLTQPFNDKIPSGLTPSRREEGFVILGRGNRLLLAGNDAGPYHGTEYAVSEFLERQGMRWFMPGEFGEVVPKLATIEYSDAEVRQSPDFPMRNWWGPRAPEMVVPEYRWKIRNRMNPVLHFLTIPQDSSTRNYLPPDKIKADPSLAGKHQDGSVDPAMPNLSNPNTVQLFADQIKEKFRKDPNMTSAAFAPDDGLPRDWTPETVKRNAGFTDTGGRVGVPAEVSTSEEWFDFVNRVTKEVKKEFPNHLIGSNGYANRNTPPQGVELDPNVYVMFAAIWSDTLHAYDDPRSWQAYRQGQMLQRWAALCKNVYMYNYTYLMLASAGTPVPVTQKLMRDMPLLKKWGIIGFSDEGRYVAMESGVHVNYLRARLEWDADQNANALLDDFYTKWYGAAATPARAFWGSLETTIANTKLQGHEDRILPYVYTPQLITQLQKAVDEAKRLADTPAAKAHVRADELILNHLRGYMAMTEAEWAGNFAEAVKQIDYMLAQRKELSQMSLWYTLPDDSTTASGFYYWGIVARQKYYQRLADMTSGKTGDLVTMFSDRAQFSLDPRDEGRYNGWYEFSPQRIPILKEIPLPGGLFENRRSPGGVWTNIQTTKPFYLQVPNGLDETGYPYLGNMWYRFNVNVPASAKGKTVKLYAPTVETEAWVWVNGKFIGHRPYHEAYERPNEIDMDVTSALQPGKTNTIAIRVNTGLNAAGQSGGFYSRLFLYSPKPGA